MYLRQDERFLAKNRAHRDHPYYHCVLGAQRKAMRSKLLQGNTFALKTQEGKFPSKILFIRSEFRWLTRLKKGLVRIGTSNCKELFETAHKSKNSL